MSEQDEKNMRPCPGCNAPVPNVAQSCWTCGHDVDPVDVIRAETATPVTAAVEEPRAPERAALTVVLREGELDAPPPASSIAPIALAAALCVAIGAIAGFMWLQPGPPAESTQTAPAVAPSAAVPAPVLESARPPAWSGPRQASWANDGSKTIAFELKATSDVPVWMGRVRPLLVVRCLYRTTEVFVAIKSAASIEEQSGHHTVRLSIDEDPEIVQQWSDSVSGQELFAPNPVALAKRLAHADRMRFTFTPYNASPVSAEFVVKGFEDLAGLVGRTCGWRLDNRGTRTASLGALER